MHSLCTTAATARLCILNWHVVWPFHTLQTSLILRANDDTYICTLMELAVDIYRNCACNISFCCCWYAKLSTLHVLRHSIRHLWRCWYYLNRLNKACHWHAVTECELEPTSHCSSMLTSSNRASLGEPLQTLSELVMNNWGEPKRAPHLRDDGLPAYAQSVVMYICMYVCMYICRFPYF